MEIEQAIAQAKSVKLRQQEVLTARRISKKRTSNDSIVLSINTLTSMLKAGLSLMECFKILAKQSNNKTLNEVYEDIAKQIEGGESIAEAMRTYPNIFSEMMIALIESGEKSGTLEKNLAFLSEFLKKQNTLNKKIKGALLYPIVILVMTAAELIGMVFLIMPKMEELFMSFPNTPEFTQMIVGISKGIRDNWPVLLIGGIISFFLLSQFFRTKTGKRVTDRIQLNFPIIKKLFRGNLLATFARTLNVLLGGGIPMAKALKITTLTINNSLYQKILQNITDEVEKGQSIALTLKKYPKDFPESFVRMIEAGESTSTLEQNLGFLYEYYSDEVEDLSSNITTLIEPILMILVGVVIGVVAIAVITPLYQFTSSINA